MQLDDRVRIRDRISAQILDDADLTKELSDEEILSMIRDRVLSEGHDSRLSVADRLILEKEIFNSLRKLDVLQELLEDDEITEVMINGPDNIFIEKRGRLFKTDKRFSSSDKLNDVIQQIVAKNNKIVNESEPIVDTRLYDGSRVNIILPPIAVDYPILSIRRFPKEPIDMKKLISLGSISEEIAGVLKVLVQAGYNIFISGGTGSGKTTFLNALTEYIPQGARIITIEDSAELRILGASNLVRLEARSRNLEGRLEVTIRDLVRASLRMRPDRIIVGECRGAEALEMLQAMNTGHDGSLSTGHANSCRDMISRLETMVLMGMDLPVNAIRQQIASGIDILIHLGRMADRSRKLLEITEVMGMKDNEVELSPVYKYIPDGEKRGTWQKTGELKHREKLVMSGYRSDII